MRISKRNAEKIKITADDIRCFLVVDDCVWCGLRNGTIQILDRQTGKVIKRGEGKVGSINALVQAGDTVWSGDSEGSIAIWKSHNGELMKKLKGHTHGVTCLTSHSSTVWSASSDFSIKVWNSLTLKNTGILKGHRNHVKCMLWVNNALWSGSDDSNILVWSSTGEKRKLEGHKAAVLTMIQVDDCVWSASADKAILVWDTNNFQLVKELRGHTNWVSFLFPMGDSEVWSGSIDKRIVSWDKKEMTRKNEFLVDDGISYLLKADDTHVWAYSQTKKTLTIYPAAENFPVNSGEEFSENTPDRNLQSPDAFSENFLAENNLGENVSEGSEGRPSSSASSRPNSAVKRLSQGPISNRNTLRVNATNMAKIPKPNLANRNSTNSTNSPNSPNAKLEKSAEKRKQVLEQLDALKKTVAAEKKIMAAVSPRTPAGRVLKTTPSGPLSSRARVPPALPSPRPKSLTLPDHNRMQLQHQVEELRDRLQIAISEKAIVDQEVQDLMDLIRSTPDLRPEIEKRDSILSKERADWAQERARYEGEAKAMKIALEEEESERVTRVRELAATRHEWEAQAKRLQSNSMTLKKQIEEKTKMMEEEERKLKGVERILLSVETKLNTKTKECLSAEERARSAEGRWKMKKASYERRRLAAEDDLREESSMRDKYQSKCSELETQTAELSLDVTKLTRKLQKTKKKLLAAEETLQAKEREMEAEQDRTLKQTQSLMDTVTETKLGVAAWLESSKNELEMANYSLSEKSDILEKEKRNLEKYVADMQKHWENTEAQVQFTKSELRKLSEENTKLNEELVKVRGRLVQESEKFTSRSPNSARTPLSRASSRGPNSARSVLTPSPSFSSPSPSLKHRNTPLSSSSPVKKRRGKDKEEESEEESDDDEEDEEKKSMFFFENYHKINEEYENLKKKMEVELRIKQEMREQLSDYEKKIKETETQRSEALKASVARANQFDTDIKALMEQLEQREDKIEKLEKQKDELILQHIKSTPPITPRSLSSVSSVASITSRNAPLKKSSSSLHRGDEDVESDDLMGDFSDDEDEAYMEEEEEELETEEKREREERRDRGQEEEEGGESEGDLMDQLTMLRSTLINLSGHVISELEENSQDRLQHFNSMKSISDDKQSLAKEKLALDWKMLFLKRRLHQQELDNEKTKDIDMAKAKMWDKIQKEKDDEVAVLEDKMRGERREWLDEEEKARRKISGLEVDLEESKKENKKLKEQLERLLLRRTEPPHDTSSNGLVRSSSAKEVEKQSPEVEVRQRSHSILNL